MDAMMRCHLERLGERLHDEGKALDISIEDMLRLCLEVAGPTAGLALYRMIMQEAAAADCLYCAGHKGVS